MSHDHHGHSHANVSHLSRAFFAAFVLNIAFAAIEAGYGWHIGSLALLSDAGHNLSDTLNIALSGLAVWAASRRPGGRYTYGYRRGTIFATLVNAVFLVATSLWLIWEWVGRLSAPVATQGLTVMAVAAIGIVVNAGSAWLLSRASDRRDINTRSAYLHLVSDALVSVGVVVSGALIIATGWPVWDAVASVLVSVFMLASALPLLREAWRMVFDAVPSSVDIESVRQAIARVEWVRSSHHLHVWPLSTTESALTVHVALSPDADAGTTKARMRAELAELGIGHATIETETVACDTEECASESENHDHSHSDGHGHAHDHDHGE